MKNLNSKKSMLIHVLGTVLFASLIFLSEVNAEEPNSGAIRVNFIKGVDDVLTPKIKANYAWVKFKDVRNNAKDKYFAAKDLYITRKNTELGNAKRKFIEGMYKTCDRQILQQVRYFDKQPLASE